MVRWLQSVEALFKDELASRGIRYQSLKSDDEKGTNVVSIRPDSGVADSKSYHLSLALAALNLMAATGTANLLVGPFWHRFVWSAVGPGRPAFYRRAGPG
jgi:hypothetical protein